MLPECAPCSGDGTPDSLGAETRGQQLPRAPPRHDCEIVRGESSNVKTKSTPTLSKVTLDAVH